MMIQNVMDEKQLSASRAEGEAPSLKLEDGSKVAVIGSGPAGSFFSYFFLELAERTGLEVELDIYEAQNFTTSGPAGCNHCGGIVSESLVQILSTEGINIPPNVVQRGIDSYVLHMDVGSIKIDTPLQEKRIAAMYRGAGPLGSKDIQWGSFDGFLQKLSVEKGAHLINDRVTKIRFDNDRPIVEARGGIAKEYDLIVGAVGLNQKSLKLFEGLGFGFQPPQATKTFICEFLLGKDAVQHYFGNSMHVFLLNLPRLKFGALIPKGDYVTMVLLGEDIDKELVQSYISAPEVVKCFPEGLDLIKSYPCQCYPKINIVGAQKPFADRVVLVGDCSVSKLYKNGIGAAHATAKAAANTVIFQGISAADFEKHYWSICKSISIDNTIGKAIFAFTNLIQKRESIKRAIFRMIVKEKSKDGRRRHMSTVMWDTFTGSAPYREILLRTLRPSCWVTLLLKTMIGFIPVKKEVNTKETTMKSGSLGKLYQDGEIIIKQGEVGDCLYVIQSGTVEIFREHDGKEVRLAQLREREFFGEMALFERDVRSGTVRVKGEARILTVDKKTLLRTIHEDPSLAFRIMEKMSNRIRELNHQITRIKVGDRRNWDSRA